MSLWFTNRLETQHLEEPADSVFSSPHRFAGAIWYKLTPTTLAWINSMIQRAENAFKKGSIDSAFLLSLRSRSNSINQWAKQNFTEEDIAAAAAAGGWLPVDPSIG